MKISYFKPHKFLDFSPNRYDVGTFTNFWHSYDDNHFLLRLCKIKEDEYLSYYNYHLDYTLENRIGSEEDFFCEVWRVVAQGVKYYENQNPFSSSHSLHVDSLYKLQQFQKYLKSIDQWNARPSHIVIAEKEEIIQQQKKEIEELHARWDKVKGYEVSQKIWIKQGYLPTVIDLFKQIEKLEVPSGGNLLKYDHQVAYPRMISKYFAHGGNDIPVETLRNYYVIKKDDAPVKGTSIQSEHKLFKIALVKETKK
ncbi:hypothetical protein [Pedobacter gandavensis]|uniref:hypothetical protein n=1 Tax=Pedobacter gandavensis TaxID=2679963 RepID=UPI00292D5261|nr:hypothetical protein [Pedobacter gandavensis]